MESITKIQKKSMKSPDETRSFEKGKVEIAKVGENTIGRAHFEPGWSWEKCVKPIDKTDSCQAPHTQYIISGKMRVKMDDGSEEEFGPGDVGYLPPGHNAWIIGNEPCVAIDFTGMKEYAKK
jgi:hypothetical protein